MKITVEEQQKRSETRPSRSVCCEAKPKEERKTSKAETGPFQEHAASQQIVKICVTMPYPPFEPSGSFSRFTSRECEDIADNLCREVAEVDIEVKRVVLRQK
jgi:hypothetical protein